MELFKGIQPMIHLFIHIILQKRIVFLHRLFLTSFICTWGHFKIFLEEMNLRVSRNSKWTFLFKNNKIKDYWTHVLKNDTSIGDIDEMVDHYLDSFEKFHKKYIIMPSLSLNLLLIEESLFVTVWSPPGFINTEN